jgi:hypothetical protein
MHLSYFLLLNTITKFCIPSLASGERFKNKIKLDFSSPFEEHLYFNIFGSINGTVCLRQIFYNANYCKTVLWNPTTQTMKLLPPSKAESIVTNEAKEGCFYISFNARLHGFGYNHVTNDYNVIRHVKVYIKPNSSTDYDGNFKEIVSHRFGDINSQKNGRYIA